MWVFQLPMSLVLTFFTNEKDHNTKFLNVCLFGSLTRLLNLQLCPETPISYFISKLPLIEAFITISLLGDFVCKYFQNFQPAATIYLVMINLSILLSFPLSI